MPMNVAQEHTTSYYAASANEVTNYPRLRGEQTADVCIIGAGFTGISTALTLVERGYDVCVLEANRIAWGASGRNGGQMISGVSGENRLLKKHGVNSADLLWEMRWAGHEIIRERVKKYEIDCDLKSGYLDVAIKGRHLRDLEADEKILTERNFPHEHRLLGRDETREMTGTDAYIGALLNMGNGHLHPLNLCVGEARAAASRGAKLFEHSAATGIEYGKKVRIITAEGAVTADFAVIAGNAYQVLEPSLKSRFFPVRSYIIATEPLSPENLRTIIPHDLAICDPNFVLEYFRLSADKRLLFGGRCNYFDEDPATIESQLRPRMSKIYPELQNIGIDYAWGGTIAVPMNRVPQIGRLAPNVFYGQAYSGHGVNVTHLSGQVLADAVGGTLERMDMFSSLLGAKIPGVTRFGNMMVSLGMMYYGLKDRM